MSRTRDQLEAYLKSLNIEAGSMLDVGGAQRPVEERLGSCKVDDIKIFDLPQPHETKTPPDFVGDINILDAIGKEENDFDEQFDVVFCLEVFDYVWDPVTAMKNLSNWTKKGGKLYVSFPFIYPHHNPVEFDALRYTEFGSKKLLENAGFKILSQFNRTADMSAAMAFFEHEGMRAARNYQNHNVVGFNFICEKI